MTIIMRPEQPLTHEIYAGVAMLLCEERNKLVRFMEQDKDRVGEELEEASELLERAMEKDMEARAQLEAASREKGEALALGAEATAERERAKDELAKAVEERAAADERWERASEDLRRAQCERSHAAGERAKAKQAEASWNRCMQEVRRVEEEVRRQREEAEAKLAESRRLLDEARAERAGVNEALRAGREEAALRKAKADTERMRVKDDLTRQTVEAAREEARLLLSRAQEEARLMVEEARRMAEEARGKAKASSDRAKKDLERIRAQLEKHKDEARRVVEDARRAPARDAAMASIRRYTVECERFKQECEERCAQFTRRAKGFGLCAQKHKNRVVGAILGFDLLVRDLQRAVDGLHRDLAREMLEGKAAAAAAAAATAAAEVVVVVEEERTKDDKHEEEKDKDRGKEEEQDEKKEDDDDASLQPNVDRRRRELQYDLERQHDLLSEMDKLREAVVYEKRKTLVTKEAFERSRALYLEQVQAVRAELEGQHAKELEAVRDELKEMQARFQHSSFAAVNLAQALQTNLCTRCESARDAPVMGLSMVVMEGGGDDAKKGRDLLFALCRPGFSGRKKQLEELDPEETRELLRCCAETMGKDKRELERARTEKDCMKRTLDECFEAIRDSYNLVHGLQLVYERLPTDAKEVALKMQLASHAQLEAVLKLLETVSEEIDADGERVRALNAEDGGDKDSTEERMREFARSCRETLRFVRGLFEIPDTMNRIGVIATDIMDCVVNMPAERAREAALAMGLVPGSDKLRQFLEQHKDHECAGCGGRRMPGGEFKWGGEYDGEWVSGGGGGGKGKEGDGKQKKTAADDKKPNGPKAPCDSS